MKFNIFSEFIAAVIVGTVFMVPVFISAALYQLGLSILWSVVVFAYLYSIFGIYEFIKFRKND